MIQMKGLSRINKVWVLNRFHAVLLRDEADWTFSLNFFRKKYAVPEDVDYFECQEQMNLELHEEYQQVERVIGTCTYYHYFTEISFLSRTFLQRLREFSILRFLFFLNDSLFYSILKVTRISKASMNLANPWTKSTTFVNGRDCRIPRHHGKTGHLSRRLVIKIKSTATWRGNDAIKFQGKTNAFLNRNPSLSRWKNSPRSFPRALEWNSGITSLEDSTSWHIPGRG